MVLIKFFNSYKKNRFAQNTLEYVLILGVVALGFSGMMLYFRRAVQSGIHVAASQLGSQEVNTDIEKGSTSESHMTTNITQDRTLNISGDTAKSRQRNTTKIEPGGWSKNVSIQ